MHLHLKGYVAGLSLLFCTYSNVQAQKTEKLTFALPQTKIGNSLYNKITLLDVRPDTSNMGMIQTGAFNKPTGVVAKEPLNIQLSNILAALTDNTAQHGELILQLRRLSFSELTSSFSEKGYFYFSAQLFVKGANGYKRINSIDTTATVSGMDVSNGLLRKGAQTLSNFIADNLKKQPTDYNYNFAEVEKIDSIGKSKLPLYNANAYKDGFYSTYKTFSEQTPDGQITVEGEKVKQGKVKAPNEKGKLKNLNTSVYAVVYKGKPYYVNEFGYYPITKSGQDFYFTGKLSQGQGAAMASSGMMYGAIGAALYAGVASAYSDQIFEVKIHYLNGDFIRLKEAKVAVVD